MTSSETSQQQQLSMHLQCVQGCLLVPDKLLSTNCLSSFSCSSSNNTAFSTVPIPASSPSDNSANIVISATTTTASTDINSSSAVSGGSSNNNNSNSPPHHHHHHHPEFVNNNNTKVAVLTQQHHPILHHHHHLNHNNNDTSSGSVTECAGAAGGGFTHQTVTSSSTPTSSSSTYLSCCSNLSLVNSVTSPQVPLVNGQTSFGSNSNGALKISDNHLSAKLVRNSSAPYTLLNRQQQVVRANSVVGSGSDEQDKSKSGGVNETSINSQENSCGGGISSGGAGSILQMGSTTANGGISGVICVNANNSSGVTNMKLEPNGNSIEINSVDNQLHPHHHLSTAAATMHLHSLQQQQQQQLTHSNGTAGCCSSNHPHHHHPHGPMNHFGSFAPNGLQNCDLDNCNNGEMSGGIAPMDTGSNGNPTTTATTFACHTHQQQSNHCNHVTSNGNSNTLVGSSPLSSSAMTIVSCNSSGSSSNGSSCNGNGVGATGGGSGTTSLNGANGPSVGNNMSPGENDDEHDCDDDKVINGDTFGAAGELPDPDAIKMFVGQVPKHMNETDLRELFEQFGRVYQINVLRDKVTKQSKGCCFVTFFTRKAALDAQNALHNIKTLPGMNNTVQMKPADNENRHDRKLFIGMISKTWNESDVRNLFSRFGTIDDCTVLRLATGQSRGCAFVTFSTKQSAQNAIKAVHQTITLEGCSSPIVVKYADTPKDKDQKRQTQLVNNQANLLGTLSSSAINPVQPQYYSSILHHHLQQTQQQGGFFSQLSPLGTVQGITGIGGLGSTSAIGLSALGSPHPSTTNADLATLLSSVNQTPHSLNFALAALGNSSLSPTGASGSSVGSGNSVANLTGNGLQSGLTSYHSGLRSAAVSAKQQHEGPDGCNLFIYHLPPELGDADLATMFASFGTVLSAKVFIDKQTNLSKCFGFVSFDNQLSAQMAIQAMHGFQLGMKRLKVQLKRAKSKDAAKPY
ncbi:unnamed protein product [Orchesella dallaii]|uniref:RRM domain-containing protein n=1 Tax=Orchesella dallaii TaxID=48710 RepID=A0ABP1PQQ5_9HEXA